MQKNKLMYKYTYILVDGYNYINAIDSFKEAAKHSLEEARYVMIENLTEYAAFTGYKIVVVFDAYNIKKMSRKSEIIDGIEIVFTKEKQTADSYIEILSNKLAIDKKNLVKVVTSDWAEQLVILGNGAFRMSPRELRLEISDMKEKIKIKQIKRTEKKKNYLEDIISDEIMKKLKNMGQ